MIPFVRLLLVVLLLTFECGLPVSAQTGEVAAMAAAEPGGRLARILQRGQLIVGVKQDYPPWGMRDADGALIGLEPDLARDLAERLGVALQLVPVIATNRLQLLEQGRVDLVIATMGDTRERRSISDLIQPHYYSSGVNLFAREGILFDDWGQLRGRPVCLSDGAFFNRTLIQRFLLDPVIFGNNHNALLALQEGRCIGWAFDDTVLAQLIREGRFPGYSMKLSTILPTPWSAAVKKGEGRAAWGRIVSDTMAEWHRTGFLEELQVKWGLPPSGFLHSKRELWSLTNQDGSFVCRREAGSEFPGFCLTNRIASIDRNISQASSELGSASWLGFDLSLFRDEYTRGQLLSGFLTTILLSAMAIVGALGFGVSLGLLDAWLVGLRRPWNILHAPIAAVIAVARMTPPILQLNIVFFGLGALIASSYAYKPGAFLVATLIFSLYAGSTNAILISTALRQLRLQQGTGPLIGLLPAAILHSFDGLIAACVNIVKAAGMASVIAVNEVVSVSNRIIVEGGDAASAMNLLLLFYFCFVTVVLWLLRRLKHAVIGRAVMPEQISEPSRRLPDKQAAPTEGARTDVLDPDR